MDSYLITRPILVVCPILFFLLVVTTTIPDTALASLETSSNQSTSNPFPFLELPGREPQSDLNRTLVENLLPSISPRHRELNLSEQITFQDSQETIFSPFEFTLSLDPRSANIYAGEAARSTIIVRLEGGNPQSISLTCNLSPSSSSGGATCNVVPSILTPNGTATLTIATENTTTPRQYTANITATPEQGIEKKTVNFAITVNARPDTTPPVITVPPSSQIRVNATSPSGAPVQYSQPSATDDVDGQIVSVCTPPSGSIFPIGDTTVTCTATDSSGNSAIPKSFTITVVEQQVPPENGRPTAVISLPPGPHRSGMSLTFSGENSNDPDGQLVGYVWDFGDGTTNNGITVTHTFREPGQYTVNLVVTDNRGARSQDTEQLIILAADEEPVIALSPSSSSQIRVNATSPSGAPVQYSQPSATDDVDGQIVSVCTPPSGSIFPIGDTTVTCTATDSSGNSAIPKSFTITVVEQQVPPENGRPTPSPNTPPIIAGPSMPVEVQAASDAGAEVSYTVTASDKEDGNIMPQCDPPSGSIFRVGETMVRCNIRDSAGSVVNKEFPVIVRQNSAPFGLPLLFIVILLIVAVAAVAVIIIFIWRRRIRKSRTDVDDEGTRVY